MYPAKSLSPFADQERVTLPVEDTGGGEVGGGAVGVGVIAGVDGWSKFANPGLIWTSRDMDGARLVMGRPD
ncbi:hypothetical protein NITLEN_10297 [Nitrospira lenta]|uniref:Uncharacterized protein n=1 Tax=Nitrospira lenta TaxID=1436998 RepID=A0A330L095_9BACT|nr:hypothetical protein NITLEN_10297 [Nitrospira lenta]